MSRTEPAVSLSDVRKTYPGGVIALDNVSLRVPEGAFLSVMGPSGSGKSTLLHCAAGLDIPDAGTVTIGDTELTGLSETRRTELRRDRVGFVFQAYNLVPALTVGQNITLPMRLAGTVPDQRWLAALIERVGIAELLDRLPSELSGGQQQRASIARALVARPDVVFADEPTGALDLHTAAEVLDLLRQLAAEFGQTIVMVTHDPAAASRAHDTLVMADGRIAELLRAPTAEQLSGLLTHLGSRTPGAAGLVDRRTDGWQVSGPPAPESAPAPAPESAPTTPPDPVRARTRLGRSGR